MKCADKSHSTRLLANKVSRAPMACLGGESDIINLMKLLSLKNCIIIAFILKPSIGRSIKQASMPFKSFIAGSNSKALSLQFISHRTDQQLQFSQYESKIQFQQFMWELNYVATCFVQRTSWMDDQWCVRCYLSGRRGSMMRYVRGPIGLADTF